MNVKKIIAVVSALLMLMPLVVSCADEAERGNSVNSGDTGAVSVGETSRENTPDSLPKDLDFDGREVKLFYGVYDPNFDSKHLEVEGDVGLSSISKAVYARNVSVEERLNIDIVFEQSNATATVRDYNTAIDNILLLSGDDSIDIIYHRAADAVSDANAGYLREVTDLKYIDLDQPWWFDEQMKSISLNQNSLYILMGDLLVSNYANMTAVFFNKEIYDNTFAGQGRDHTELYDMVESNEWTWEKYFGIVADTYSDEDGNGYKSEGDIFGAHTETGNRTATYYPYSCGLKLSVRNSEGFPVLNYNTPDVINMVEKLYSFVYENKGTMTMSYDDAESAFYGERLLFYSYFLSRGTSIVANATFEYGVLPFPKYGEFTDYTTPVLVGAGVYVIPKFLSDGKLDVVGAALEALCAESYRRVSLNYYDNVLKTRQSGGARDADMIDIIKDHVVSDFTFWNGSSIGNPDTLFKQIVITNESKDFVSHWGKNGTMYEGNLQMLIKIYKQANK